MAESEEQQNQEESTINKKGIAFAVIILVYEILVIFLYGFLFGYNSTLFTSIYDVGGILITSIMAILMIVGFGLINAYVTRSAVTGMGYTLLIFALTVQHFFLMRAFWNKAGANDPASAKTYDDNTYYAIGLSNYGTDRQSTANLPTASFPDAIACALSIMVAACPVIGRVGLLEIFFLTLFGSFLYEVNSQLLHRWYITDTGYGMRILLFGSFLGLVSACILGKKETTLNHPRYKSEYQTRALSLFGFVLVFCAFPMLCVAGLLTYSQIDGYIIYSAAVNMWLALLSGILGCYVSSAFTHRRFSIHDLIFGGLGGGFVFSSSADINFNPAVPLVLGFLMGFISSIFSSGLIRKSNAEGVIYTYAHYQRFLTPGLGCCIVSAVLHGTGDWANGNYGNYLLEGRSATGQGAFQLIAIPLSLGIATLGGVIVGVIYKIVNGYEENDQFKDEKVYKPLEVGQQYEDEE